MKKLSAIVGAVTLVVLALAAVPQQSRASTGGPDKEFCEFLIEFLDLDVPLGECMSFFAMLTNPASSDTAAQNCQELRTFGLIGHHELGRCVSVLRTIGAP